jgi:hypothetical protein
MWKTCLAGGYRLKQLVDARLLTRERRGTYRYCQLARRPGTSAQPCWAAVGLRSNAVPPATTLTARAADPTASSYHQGGMRGVAPEAISLGQRGLPATRHAKSANGLCGSLDTNGISGHAEGALHEEFTLI